MDDMHPLVFMLLLMNIIGVLLCGICTTYKNFKTPNPWEIQPSVEIIKIKSKKSPPPSTSGFTPKKPKPIQGTESVGNLSIGSQQTRLVPLKKLSDAPDVNSELLLEKLRRLNSEASILKTETSILKVPKKDKKASVLSYELSSPNKKTPSLKNGTSLRNESLKFEPKKGESSLRNESLKDEPRKVESSLRNESLKDEPRKVESSLRNESLKDEPRKVESRLRVESLKDEPRKVESRLRVESLKDEPVRKVESRLRHEPSLKDEPNSPNNQHLSIKNEPDLNKKIGPNEKIIVIEEMPSGINRNRSLSNRSIELIKKNSPPDRGHRELTPESSISIIQISHHRLPETSHISRINEPHSAPIYNPSSFSLPSNAFSTISPERSRHTDLPTALNLLHQLEPYITKPTCPPRRSVDPLSNNYRRYSFHRIKPEIPKKTEEKEKTPIFEIKSEIEKPEEKKKEIEEIENPEMQLFTIVEEEKSKKKYERPEQDSQTSFFVAKVPSNRLSGLGQPQSEEQFFKKISEPVIDIPSNSRLYGLTETYVNKKGSTGSLLSSGSQKGKVRSLPTIIETREIKQIKLENPTDSPLKQPPQFIIKDRSPSIEEIEEIEEPEELEVIKEDDDEIIKFTSRTLIRPPETLPDKSEGTGPLRIETRQRKYSTFDTESPDKCCCKLIPKDKIQEFTNMNVFKTRASRSTQDQARYICEVIKPIPSLMRSNQRMMHGSMVEHSNFESEENKPKPKEEETTVQKSKKV